MNELSEYVRSRRGAIWIVILVIAVALTLCYLIAGAAGLMAVYPPARTLVYGLAATDLPTPLPGTRPTRIPVIVPTEPAIEIPSDVVVQAGIMGGAPTLYDLAPAWEELTAPGMNAWNITFSYDQPVSLGSGWCAATDAVLEENFQHIAFLLQIDFEDISVGDLAWVDEPGNGGVCRSYSGFVQAWPPGSHTVIMTMRLDRAINDGWNGYSAGDYMDRFNISVTR